MRQLIAAPTRMRPHSTVGQVPNMVIARPRTVNNKTVMKSCPINHRLHDAICRRGAADVAEADKKYSYLLFVFQRVVLYSFIAFDIQIVHIQQVALVAAKLQKTTGKISGTM